MGTDVVKRLYTLLDLNRNGPKECKERAWRSTVMAPYNSNFMFVLLQCPVKGFLVMTLANEQVCTILSLHFMSLSVHSPVNVTRSK